MRKPSAALAVVVAGMAAALGSVAGAQVPSPPHRFYGEARINGVAAPDGTAVVALVGTVECGRSETAGGMYRVDAAAQSMRPGCGGAGAEVRFQVGPGAAVQTGTWKGATVTQLDLTTQAGAYRTATLGLDSPCIPAPGAARCDTARLRLWKGDAEAWEQRYTSLGLPPATKPFADVVKLRLEAGDPAARAMAATTAAWPYLKITAIHFRGTQPGEADEYIEIANLGGGPQPMDGWRVKAASSGAEFRFRAGSVLKPGERCRVYTGQTQAGSCPGYGFGATYGLWDDSADTATLTVDFPAITADTARYVADPAAQPMAPALRGSE